MKKHLIMAFLFAFIALPFVSYVPVYAQVQELNELETAIDELAPEATSPAEATDSAEASASAEERRRLQQLKEDDVTQPEQPEVKDRYLELLEQRPIDRVSLLNFFGYAVQYAVDKGVPANTIILVLLLPLLATIIAFVRHVIGLPSIGIFVPVALSITFISTGITAGLILIVSILLASSIARIFLKRVQLMQMPKVALSMFVVSLFIFLTLAVSAGTGLLVVRQISIFPVLLLILLSERVTQLHLERSPKETFNITFVTLVMGILGYLLLSYDGLRDTVLLYPEVVLLLIPANILIGRYFGLRLTEYYRFSPIRNASK